MRKSKRIPTEETKGAKGRKGPKDSCVWGLVFAVAMIVAGCARHPYQEGLVESRPEEVKSAVERLESRYPKQFRLKQRLALRALGKQYDMIGYLVVNGDGSLRAVALGEMGGRIFDLALEDGKPKILKKPEKMPPKPLLDGVIGDIRHLFMHPEHDAAFYRKDERDGGCVSLRRGTGKDLKISDFWFDEGTQGELARSLQSDGRRILREAEYFEYKRLPGFKQPIPTRIILKNYRWHYTLEAQALEISAEGRAGSE